MQKLPKCRKHIRKRRHLIMAFKSRNDKTKWLSTHLWAARRMHMINYHGYKVANSPNDKCFRSSYRHFRHNCCLIDLSYLQCLTIQSQNVHDYCPK
jgi:ribonuclease P/MRP protein subunit POP1